MKDAIIKIDGKEIETIKIADNFFTRLKGLMGKTEAQIKDMGGLLIKPCGQIHTFGMKASIDVIYVDKKYKIVQMNKKIKPRKCCRRVKGAYAVIELPPGFISEHSIRQEDDIVIEM